MSFIRRLFLILFLAFCGVAQAGPNLQRHQSGELVVLETGEKYILRKELGAGSYGTVFSAGPLRSEESFALKFFSRVTQQLGIFDLILQGYESAQGLKHPALIPMEFVKLDTGEVAIRMPLAEKRLSYHLQEHLTDAERLQIAVEVFAALKPLIQTLIVNDLNYGDFKPDNIVRVNGEWKVVDFDSLAQLGLRKDIATAHYAPPEVRTAKATHWTSDSYSVSRTIGTILLGNQLPNSLIERKKWSQQTLQKIYEYYPEFKQPQYQELRQFISAALAEEAEERAERLQRVGIGNSCARSYR